MLILARQSEVTYFEILDYTSSRRTHVTLALCADYTAKSSLLELEDGSERLPEVHLFNISKAAFG